MWKRLLLVALVVWGAHSWWTTRELRHGPGVVAPHVPEQTAIGSGKTFELNGYRITPLAEFTVQARVLSREHYRMGREADLSPIDFALGWGRMSDETVLSAMDIRQSNRFFFWQVANELPIPRREIETSAANMHLIPADKTISNQLDNVRQGQVVRLSGYLVRADASDGWHWVSSLSRDDVGAGACELLYVKDVRVAM